MIDGQKIAKARDEFFKNNPEILKEPVSNPYLKNRIEKAFIDGIHFAEKFMDNKNEQYIR